MSNNYNRFKRIYTHSSFNKPHLAYSHSNGQVQTPELAAYANKEGLVPFGPKAVGKKIIK